MTTSGDLKMVREEDKREQHDQNMTIHTLPRDWGNVSFLSKMVSHSGAAAYRR